MHRKNAQFSHDEMIFEARERRNGDFSERSERRHSFVKKLQNITRRGKTSIFTVHPVSKTASLKIAYFVIYLWRDNEKAGGCYMAEFYGILIWSKFVKVGILWKS